MSEHACKAKSKRFTDQRDAAVDGIRSEEMSYEALLEGLPFFRTLPFSYISLAVIIIMNSTVVYIFLTREYIRERPHNGVLFSLAVCDFCYEVTTTILAEPYDDGTAKVPRTRCRALFFCYVLFSACTVLHVYVLVISNVFRSLFSSKHLSLFSSGLLTVSLWLVSVCVACVSSCIGRWNPLQLTDMSSLSHLKKFGLVSFNIIFFSAGIINIWVINSGKLRMCKADETESDYFKKIPHEQHHPTTMARSNQKTSKSCRRNERGYKFAVITGVVYMVVSFCWLARFLVWTDGAITSAEVMKYFEIARLTARLLNPLMPVEKSEFRLALAR